MDMKRILQAMDGVATKPVVGVNDMAKFLTIINEGSNLHKVTLPVQMAMQHYQKPQKEKQPIVEKIQPVVRSSSLRQYYNLVESEQLSKAMKNKKVKENAVSGHHAGFKPLSGVGMGNYVVDEAPLDFDKENPVASTIHGHKSNPGSIEYRIMRARRQLKELAQMSESNDLLTWETIARHFPELAMNIEEVRHGIEELAKIKKGGGRRSSNVPSGLGETNSIKEANAKKRSLKNSNPCWKGYHPVGTKKKGGRTVPNCVPKE